MHGLQYLLATLPVLIPTVIFNAHIFTNAIRKNMMRMNEVNFLFLKQQIIMEEKEKKERKQYYKRTSDRKEYGKHGDGSQQKMITILTTNIALIRDIFKLNMRIICRGRLNHTDFAYYRR